MCVLSLSLSVARARTRVCVCVCAKAFLGMFKTAALTMLLQEYDVMSLTFALLMLKGQRLRCLDRIHIESRLVIKLDCYVSSVSGNVLKVVFDCCCCCCLWCR